MWSARLVTDGGGGGEGGRTEMAEPETFGGALGKEHAAHGVKGEFDFVEAGGVGHDLNPDLKER